DGGTVKILDFGLAKAFAADDVHVHAADSPWRSIESTEQGIILGTAPYMAPEQARGKKVDRRVDIWAFGCVLFEMLTGKRAFEGEGISDTLPAVLGGVPVWKALPLETPAAIIRVLHRCLEKDPRRRFHDIADAQI